jgi:outer membrane cobalamin receptor
MVMATLGVHADGKRRHSPNGTGDFKSITLEELSQIHVTTPSREPVSAFQTPTAIFVITGDDIKRSGATSIPEALRLAPGVEVARIDSNKWSIGIRGLGSLPDCQFIAGVSGEGSVPAELHEVHRLAPHRICEPRIAGSHLYPGK